MCRSLLGVPQSLSPAGSPHPAVLSSLACPGGGTLDLRMVRPGRGKGDTGAFHVGTWPPRWGVEGPRVNAGQARAKD